MREITRRSVLTHALATGTLAAAALTVGTIPGRRAISVPTTPVANVQYPLGFSAGSAILYYDANDQNLTLDGIVALRGTRVRFDIPWHFVQPTASTWNWGFVDAVVDKARARNLDILAVLTGCPPWAALGGSTIPTTRPASASTYGAFAAAAARRYNGRISAFEVWNEPNGAAFFAPTPDPAFYGQMVAAAYNAIKAVNPALTVVAGALGPVNNGPGLIDSLTFATGMYNGGAAGKFDALSMHPYENDATIAEAVLFDNSPARQLIALHQLMASRGDGAKKIWLTEYGASTFDISAEAQRDLILGSLGQWGEVSFAGPVYLYTVRDEDSSAPHSEAQFGVFNSSYQPKPAAYAIEAFTRQNMPARTEGQTFAANSDPALGAAVSPVFRVSYGYGQEYENGSRYLSNAGFLSSPPAMAARIRQIKALPISPFTNGYQDFDVPGGLRMFSSPATGTYFAVGLIQADWTPDLGLATTDQYTVPGTSTVANDFERGRITFTPGVGTTITRN